MKRFFLISTALIGLLFLVGSCEDIIEVEVPSEEPRLIIDALVRVDTTEQFTNVWVEVRETNSFFESVPPANIQQITMTGVEAGGISAILLEDPPNSGNYTTIIQNEALMSERIILQIDFNDEYFVAFAEFVPTVPINSLEQGDGTLFNDDDTEVIVRFKDNGERDDFYLFDFDLNNYLVSEDKFYQGQEFEFSYFYDSNQVSPGDSLDIKIMGVSEEFYNYMNLLIDQSEQDFGPFETPAVTVRGNIINATEIDNIENFDNVNMSDNFALGYFAIVQEHKQSITIE